MNNVVVGAYTGYRVSQRFVYVCDLSTLLSVSLSLLFCLSCFFIPMFDKNLVVARKPHDAARSSYTHNSLIVTKGQGRHSTDTPPTPARPTELYELFIVQWHVRQSLVN